MANLLTIPIDVFWTKPMLRSPEYKPSHSSASVVSRRTNAVFLLLGLGRGLETDIVEYIGVYGGAGLQSTEHL